MDPNRCWNQLLTSIATESWEDARAYASELYQWIHSGGFPPDCLKGRDDSAELLRSVLLLCNLTLLDTPKEDIAQEGL